MSHDVAIPNRAKAGAVLLHPHPDFGGDRHNVVVSALYRALPEAGIAALRFDFGSSEPGQAAADTVTAIDDLVRRLPSDVPMIIAAYSFGADIALTVTDERIAGWFLVAPPLTVVPAERWAAAHDPRPKAVAVPEHDQFSSPTRAASLTADWTATFLETIPGGDHFLVGRTGHLVDACLRFIADGLSSVER